MKKIFTLAALAAICFASCSKNEVIVPQTEGNQINFGTYTANAPVAKALDLDGSLTEIWVNAYHPDVTLETTQPKFMVNEQVTKKDGAWGYTNTKYWPANKDAELTFFAVAPMIDALKWPADANTLTYTVDAVAEDQTDLLWNKVVKSHAQTIGENLTEDQVKFKMEHMLSRLDVAVKLNEAYNNVKFTINSITLGDATTGFATSCTFDLLTGETTAPSGNQGFTWTDAADDSNNDLAAELSLATADGTTAKPALAANNQLILVPQELTDIPVTIVYTDQDGIPQTKSGKVNLNLEAKTQYTLTINIQLCDITFDVEHEDWTTGVTVDNATDWTWNTPTAQ